MTARARLAAVLAPDLLDALELLVDERVREAPTDASPWMTRPEAAEYLRLPLSRLEKDRGIPCHRDGGRVLYHRAEVDAYMLCRRGK